MIKVTLKCMVVGARWAARLSVSADLLGFSENGLKKDLENIKNNSNSNNCSLQHMNVEEHP